MVAHLACHRTKIGVLRKTNQIFFGYHWISLRAGTPGLNLHFLGLEVQLSFCEEALYWYTAPMLLGLWVAYPWRSASLVSDQGASAWTIKSMVRPHGGGICRGQCSRVPCLRACNWDIHWHISFSAWTTFWPVFLQRYTSVSHAHKNMVKSGTCVGQRVICIVHAQFYSQLIGHYVGYDWQISVWLISYNSWGSRRLQPRKTCHLCNI